MPLPWFDPDAIARRLREARGARSQRELGRLLGYRQPHVSRYEHGEVPGSYRYLAGLAALLGADLNWILTGRRSLPQAGGIGPTVTGELEALVRRAVGDEVTRLVTGLEHGAGVTGRFPIPQRPLRTPAAASLLPEHERLMLELPMALQPLFVARPALEEPRRRSGVSTAAPEARGAAGVPGPRRAAAAPAADATQAGGVFGEVLERVGGLAWAGDADRVTEELARAAEEAEAGARRADLEAARVLRLWAWIVLESFGRADATGRSAELLFGLARATRLVGRARDAVPIYAEAIRRADAAGDPVVAARANAGLGHVHFEAGDFAAARARYVAALERALESGDATLRMFAHLDLAACHDEQGGDAENILEHARAGLEIAERAGDRDHAARFLNEMGLAEMERGRDDEAAHLFEEVLAIAAELGQPLLKVIGSNNLAALRLRQGRTGEARQLLASSVNASRAQGWAWAECQAEILMARLEHGEGERAAALRRLGRVRDRAATEGLANEDRRARELEAAIRGDVLVRPQGAGA